jgi:hypothetical protein
MAKKQKIDVLAIETEKKLPHWLLIKDQATQDKIDKIRAKHRAEYLAKRPAAGKKSAK